MGRSSPGVCYAVEILGKPGCVFDLFVREHPHLTSQKQLY
ncbi:hypothetical protein CA1H_6761 [Chlamydia abortus]|uniref:Uncharacterized protein n=1 Tax=Chlamydia abortus (strain DSM 27085 / S26/3) TaxID=218497 RepID=Q5L5N6_CHLAB|nr:uncharacterized protein CHAB577_0659 [Chlamydia abortus]CAH64054.1 hypothetical protein CAB607 [Chlamydia abortus S26/3]CAD7584126.1 hypothetical protein [Chlamydia abortus]CED80659.1 hypothetical protein AB7_6761 [Chlamydia abortus]CED81619.1 hypothetical protein CA1H_6761 [Chlamydia abortus]